MRPSAEVVLHGILLTIDRHRRDSPRTMPDFDPAQIEIIRSAYDDYDWIWAQSVKENLDSKPNYHASRKKFLDARMERMSWSPELRNLVSSVMSTVKMWQRKNAKPPQDQDRINTLLEGAELLFPALRIQHQTRLWRNTDANQHHHQTHSSP